MKFFTPTFLAIAAGALLINATVQAAPVTLDFHLVLTEDSGGPDDATRTPPFSGSLEVDDTDFGTDGLDVFKFSFDFFDRVITQESTGFGTFIVDLSDTGVFTLVDFNYDTAFDLSIDATGDPDSSFTYGYTNCCGGAGSFVNGKAPPQPETPAVPLPASALLLMGGLGISFGAVRRRNKKST